MTEKGTFTDGKWTFEISESHILRSEGPDRDRSVGKPVSVRVKMVSLIIFFLMSK